MWFGTDGLNLKVENNHTRINATINEEITIIYFGVDIQYTIVFQWGTRLADALSYFTISRNVTVATET